MDFSLFYQFKNSQSRWINYAFYFASILLIIMVFFYGIFVFKVYSQSQKIDELNRKMLVYGTDQQKASEKKVLDYKKKIDDFTVLINNHKVSLNVFTFIEQNTLSNIWFSSFNVSEVRNEINLIGEAKNMETLNNQVRVFEEDKDYIKSVSVLDSQVIEQGKIRFTLKLSLDPKIFAYNPNGFIGSPNSSGNTINNQ